MNNGQTQAATVHTSDSHMVTVLLFRLLPVQILIAAVGTINSIVSGLFAGNFVGEAAMSAIALYGPIRLLMTALNVMLFGGSTILCGRYLGRNQQEKIQSLFSLDIFLAAASGTVFCLVMIVISSSDLSAFMIQDDSVRVVFNQYLLGQAVGVLPFFLGRQLSVFLTMRNQINLTTIASLIMIAVNALLNLLFVAVLHWGAFGIALAFSLGNWAFFAVQALYLLRGKDAPHFALRRVSWPDCGQIIKIGLPGAASTIYQSVLGIIVNGLITAYVGSVGLSAYAASDTVLSFFWSIPAGMLAVSRMLLSISIGEEDRQTLTNVMRNMFRCFVPLMCAVSVVIILLAEPLTQQFYRNPSAPVYMMTVRAFQILPLSMPLSVICMHFVCYGQVSDKQALIHILSVLDGVICIAVFSALLIPTLGMNGVYIANVLNGVVTLLTVFVYSVLKNRRIPRNTEELMVIPDSFGVSVRHGFQADKKKHSVDIRVVYKKSGVLLRIKDDCKPFDPGEWKKVTAPSDPASNIGIRLVFQIAESVEYQSVLGLNVLSIRI